MRGGGCLGGATECCLENQYTVSADYAYCSSSVWVFVPVQLRAASKMTPSMLIKIAGQSLTLIRTVASVTGCDCAVDLSQNWRPKKGAEAPFFVVALAGQRLTREERRAAVAAPSRPNATSASEPGSGTSLVGGATSWVSAE